MGPPAKPDVSIIAAAKARELRFREVPETEVRFWGFPRHKSASCTERENLPCRVGRDIEYKDATVKLRIAGRLVKEIFPEPTE